MYQPRFYRNWIKTSDLVSFNVQVSESDLNVQAKEDLSEVIKELLLKYRGQIESHIQTHPDFAKSLKPYPAEPLAPKIIRDMCFFGEKAGVGPMAAVAGAIAENIGTEILRKHDTELIIENGGDIFLASKKERKIGIYSGKSMPALNVEIKPEQMPCGICTSSGKMGHSMSFGKADSVTVLAKSCTLADAVATAACNQVQSEDDIKKSIEFAMNIEEVEGVVVVINRKIGIKGNLKLT
ncbi:MAG: UPF0280 family protein [Endomicrobiales bacterium]|nr:UPF0280 family protein [Endomicrobiales bacterium]